VRPADSPSTRAGRSDHAAGAGRLIATRSRPLVGLSAWLLLLEDLVLANLSGLGFGRVVPGTAALAIAGQDLAGQDPDGQDPDGQDLDGQDLDGQVLSPEIAQVLLGGYAAAVGAGRFSRRDVD
jgi:hypothetical protein